MSQLPAGRVEDFAEGQARVVTLAGREIGVVRWHDQFFAVRNVCPHEGAGLCQGTVRPLLSASKVGHLEADNNRPVVTCPWHGWEFDLRTGEAIYGDPKCRVRSYTAHVDGNDVVVDVGN